MTYCRKTGAGILKLKYYRKDRLEGFKTGQNLQADEK
jgi:hypothetical protein